jgi:hypothetical protein
MQIADLGLRNVDFKKGTSAVYYSRFTIHVLLFTVYYSPFTSLHNCASMLVFYNFLRNLLAFIFSANSVEFLPE